MGFWKKLLRGQPRAPGEGGGSRRHKRPSATDATLSEDPGNKQCTRCGERIPPHGVIECPKCGCGTFTRL